MSRVRLEPASDAVLGLIHRLTVQEPNFWHIPAPLIDRATFDSFPKRWFVGIDEASGKTLGYCALSAYDQYNRSAFFGVLVVRELRSTGAIVHLARAFIDMAFGELGLHTLMSNSIEGSPMARMAEKFGWTRAGVLRDAQLIQGTWHDRVIHQAINPRDR